MPIENDNSNYNKTISSKKTTIKTESLVTGINQQQLRRQQRVKDDSDRRKNPNSKNIEELDIEHLKPNLKLKIKEEFKKHKEEQLILLKENKQNIIDFIIDNKESIRVEDLKIYGPVYKCYREKGNSHICNRSTNIICKKCKNTNHHICTNHWQEMQ